MQALSLWRPYPWAFFYPPPGWRKWLENRDWAPPKKLIGERIALHAGKHFDTDGHDFIATTLNDWRKLNLVDAMPEHYDDGGIIGTVKLIGWLEGESWDEAMKFMRVHGGPDAHEWIKAHPEQRRWFIGRYAWIVTEPRLLQQPIQCRGFQKLWNLDEEMAKQVRKNQLDPLGT